MIKKAILTGLTLSLVGLVSAASARADNWDKKTAEEKETAVSAAIQTTPVATVTNGTSSMTGTTGSRTTKQLPKTASTLPMIMVLGLGCLGIAVGLMVFSMRAIPAIVERRQ